MNNRIFDAFDNIHAEEQLKRHTRNCLREKPARRRTYFGTYFAGYAVASILCLLVLTGFGGYRIYMKPVATISIDINPSMEWEVNQFDRVISVTYYNRDARNAASHLKLMHKKYDDAMELLLTSREMAGYLTEDAVIDIAVTSENEAKSTEMQTRAAQCAGKYCSQVSHHTGSVEDMDAAHEVGLSFGKYQAFLVLQGLNPEITVEDIRGMCMSELRTMIEDYSDGAASGNAGSIPGTSITNTTNNNTDNNSTDNSNTDNNSTDNSDTGNSSTDNNSTDNNYSNNTGSYGHGGQHHMGHTHN